MVIILYLVGLIILKCAKKCYTVCAVGRGAKESNLGEVVYIIDPNPL